MEGLFIPFYKPILKNFLMEKIISISQEPDEKISKLAYEVGYS